MVLWDASRTIPYLHWKYGSGSSRPKSTKKKDKKKNLFTVWTFYSSFLNFSLLNCMNWVREIIMKNYFILIFFVMKNLESGSGTPLKPMQIYNLNPLEVGLGSQQWAQNKSQIWTMWKIRTILTSAVPLNVLEHCGHEKFLT